LICVLIFLEPDYSALLTILIITGILLFLAHIDWWQMILLTLGGTGMFALVIRFTDTGSIRWEQFRTGWRDPGEAISQVQRTFESIVNGGIFGVGIGQGTVKFTGLEVGQTDTIFTIIAEELGLVGCLIVLALFALILWRGIKISQESSDLSGQLIAAGITFWVVAEAFINIASLINLIPIGGNTLPFFSKGGSSLISIMTGVGFVLSVSRVNQVTKSRKRSSHSAVVDMRWRDRGRSISRARGTASTHR
jgi:cell division protein FtsW